MGGGRDHAPTQDRRAARKRLAAIQDPAVLAAGGGGARQAATRRAAHLWLARQAVDQRASAVARRNHLASDALEVRIRPDGRVAHAAQQGGVHGHDERQGRVAPGQGGIAEHYVAHTGTSAAQRLGDGQTEIAVARQLGQAFHRKRPVVVMAPGVLGGDGGGRRRAIDDAAFAR